ncbi:MAG TPA: hypothetical protein VKB96_00615 [Gammaproteobacteria bacterium]|jgi:hypothetical protein|nr:hypothetical protein [Gammaproteobacteria bacterium]
MNNEQARHRLAPQFNEGVINGPCALCGGRTNPERGPELFLMGTFAPVCYECGRQYEPQLMDMLFEYRQSLLEADVRPDSLAADDDNLSLPF